MTTPYKEKIRRWPALLATALLLAWSWANGAGAALLTEPPTVFYGKVLGTAGAQPFIVTSGQLTWTIRRADGVELTLQAPLYALNDGELSYRLDVPHQAVSLGLVVTESGVPLGISMEEHSHARIEIEGLPARIAGGGSAVFGAAQILRTATHRLDLEVALVPEDSDGDGMADWWEDQYGLDSQDPADAALDSDGDGLTNLDEYLQGLDPTRDSRRPVLATTSVQGYSGCTTLLTLQALDIDSPPADLVYRLQRLPAVGTLILRNQSADSDAPDHILGVNDPFTQEDVNAGRVIFTLEDTPLSATDFAVSVADPVGAVTGEVAVAIYRPADSLTDGQTDTQLVEAALYGIDATMAPTNEHHLIRHYILGHLGGYMVGDGSGAWGDLIMAAPSAGHDPSSYQAAFGPDHPHALTGGRGNDVLSGGMGDDRLNGGPGANTLVGGPGRDLFVFEEVSGDSDTVSDFNMEEGDVLDLSPILQASSGWLRDFVALEASAEGGRVKVSVDGSGGAGGTVVAKLTTGLPGNGDLHDLVTNGTVRVGALQLWPRLSIYASVAVARENGPTPGVFTLVRSGDLSAPITVQLMVSGSAANGVDYAYLPDTLTMAAGVRTAQVLVTPYADAIVEPSEVVEVMITPATTYDVGSADRASVYIEDLKPVLDMETLEPLAVRDPLASGMMLLRREVVSDRSLLVRLAVGGTASNGQDYNTIDSYLYLEPGQTSALIPVTPKADADITGNAESVLVSLLSDAAYLLGDVSRAKVILIDHALALDTWQNQEYPEFSGSIETFALDDPGGYGIPNLQRYAYGLDPRNPDRSRLPRAVMRNGFLTVDVWRNPAARDIRYVVEASRDLLNWAPASVAVESLELPEHAEDPWVMSYRAVPNSGDDPDRMFMAVRVIYSP